MPGRFGVPDSNLSGIAEGWVSSWEKLPVPPSMRLEHASAIQGLQTTPPIPWGPMSPLWPVKQRAPMDRSETDISSKPPVWAESSTNGTDLLWHVSATASRSCRVPHTLLPWHTTARSPPLKASRKLSSGRVPS